MPSAGERHEQARSLFDDQIEVRNKPFVAIIIVFDVNDAAQVTVRETLVAAGLAGAIGIAPPARP
jgi:hypothetical protein